MDNWSSRVLFFPTSSHLKPLSLQRVLSEMVTTGNSSKAAKALATSADHPPPTNSRSMQSAMKQVPKSRSALILALALTGFLGTPVHGNDRSSTAGYQFRDSRDFCNYAINEDCACGFSSAAGGFSLARLLIAQPLGSQRH